MIRSRRVTKGGVAPWFLEVKHSTGSHHYVVRVLTEQASGRAAVLDDLKLYVAEAHEDAGRKLAAALAPSLSPFVNLANDPAFGYPKDLHISTLMGYFGEILAGIVAEHTDVHGAKTWEVPAFLFRFHQVAFQALEDRHTLLLQGKQLGSVDADSATKPGRTGSDLVAFLRGDDGELVSIMVCEAKCLSAHKMETLEDAHSQLSTVHVCPNGVRDLIEILADYSNQSARDWRERLLRFRFSPPAHVTRLDVLVYATGNRPTGIQGRTSWATLGKPATTYTGKRRLEVVEIHLEDPRELVRTLYRA